MPKEKVTLTLDSEKLQELRSLVGGRSLSAAVNASIGAYVARLRHLKAVDNWLAELERERGPIPAEASEWAARQVEQWQSSRGGPGRRAS